MRTAAICSRARNRIAKTMGLKISHVHPEKLTSTVWTNQLAVSFICDRSRKRTLPQKTERKNEKRQLIRTFLGENMFSFYSCELWQELRGTHFKNTIFNLAPTQTGGLTLLRTDSAQIRNFKFGMMTEKLFFHATICLKLALVALSRHRQRTVATNDAFPPWQIWDEVLFRRKTWSNLSNSGGFRGSVRRADE